ncbi:MAG: hypothetical protein M0C28_05800 [Candidatus Moduliflexus flocculans]|nr:hypothetical protein [Candidatus Moduliflexus flocculans]
MPEGQGPRGLHRQVRRPGHDQRALGLRLLLPDALRLDRSAARPPRPARRPWPWPASTTQTKLQLLIAIPQLYYQCRTGRQGRCRGPQAHRLRQGPRATPRRAPSSKPTGYLLIGRTPPRRPATTSRPPRTTSWPTAPSRTRTSSKQINEPGGQALYKAQKFAEAGIGPSAVLRRGPGPRERHAPMPRPSTSRTRSTRPWPSTRKPTPRRGPGHWPRTSPSS